jgi:ribosomal protein S8
MDTSEIISAWLARFDLTIDALAVDPEAVKQDNFLRRAFELAFPPEGLPEEIKVKAVGKADLLEPVVVAHRPYYLASTKETTKINPKTGEEKANSVLVLRLKKIAGIAQVLKEHGFIRRGTKLDPTGGVPVRSRGTRGEYAKTVSLMLKMRQHQQAELEQLEALERHYESRGDSETAKRYKEEHKRVAEQVKRLGAGL